MALDPVPWAVGGGADHSPETARMDTWVKTRGAEGIAEPNSLRVWSESTPTTTIRVLPGGALINNRYPGGEYQSYTARNASQTSIPVTATGSSSGRTDLLVMRILDPQYEGQPPADPNNFDYTRLELIEGVPAGTLTAKELNLGYPAIELAKLTLPAFTATVTQDMITDLRKVALPRVHEETRTLSVTSPTDETLSATSLYPDGGTTWPLAAEDSWGFFDIPEWATRVKLIMTWSQIRHPGGDVWGHVWVQVGYSVNPDHFVTQAVNYDTSGVANQSRMAITAADERPIPAALRGGRHKIYPRGNVLGGAARLHIDAGSAMILQAVFMERAD